MLHQDRVGPHPPRGGLFGSCPPSGPILLRKAVKFHTSCSAALLCFFPAWQGRFGILGRRETVPAGSDPTASMWLLRVVSSAVFLTAIILSIPLAFDVGGKTCGLAYSLSLASFYFGFSLLQLATPDESRVRRSLVIFVRSTQWLIVPTLLIWSLNRFSVDSNNHGSSWVERTFDGRRATDTSIRSWVFGHGGLIETLTIGNWDKLLRWSTPIFQLVEGFCTLLVIQAAGQITRWLVNRSGRGDTWMVGWSLVFTVFADDRC